MANKRINDLPEATSTTVGDKLAVDGATTRSITVENFLADKRPNLGIDNVDNTSDADKPVSTAQAAAIAVVQGDVDTHEANTSNPHGVTKTQVGLGNVDNTSDATKNAASATLTNKTLTSPVINTPTGIVKGDVGLGNVDNTSDATKNSATATLTNKTISGASNTLTVREADLSTSDVTTANVSTTKHGFAPKLPNDATVYLDGTGSYSTPAGGGGGAYFAPQGRITLTSATPVMGSSVAAATTVYYTPYAGDLVPLYDGTSMTPAAFAQVSQATTDTTKSPAAVAANKFYDLFCWNDGGVKRCTRGPAWTNSTTRGYTFTIVNGIALNTSAITNGPAASRGTWVGTIASNATSTVDYVFGSAASGGGAAYFGVWNAYNRVPVATTVSDNGAQYNYSSSTIRQARASAGNQVTLVAGAAGDPVSAKISSQFFTAAVANAFSAASIGVNTTSAHSFGRSICYAISAAGNLDNENTGADFPATLGLTTVSRNEQGDGTNSNACNGSSADFLSVTVWN